MSICELRLAGTDISAKAVKGLRGYFPNVSISGLKQTIEGGEPFFPVAAVLTMVKEC